MSSELTGRINVTFGCIRVLAGDMMHGTHEEQVAARLLKAVEAAVLLGNGDELLALVRPWMEAKSQELLEQAMRSAVAARPEGLPLEGME